jgi:VWFA-related protein
MIKAAAICFLLLAAQSLFAQASRQLTPAEILARAGDVYASCRSYADEGDTSTFIGIDKIKPGRYRPYIEHFITAFVRPDAFRFEFYAGRQIRVRFVAWKSGPLEKFYSPNRMPQDNLNEMLMGLFLPSHGTALRVPALLMPDRFHGKGLFASLTDLKLGREEKIEGHQAFKIEARLENDPFNLWIDADRFLILQIEQVVRQGGSDVYTSTRYRPVLNGDIAAEKLAFNAAEIEKTADAPADAPVRSAPELKNNVRPRLKDFGRSVSLNSAEIEGLSRQAERGSGDEDVVRVDTDMVVSDVLVVDPQGRSVEGLSTQDFIVKEDDQPQEIGSLSQGNSDQVPRSIVLIIDYSNSQLPYVITSVDAAKKLVDQMNRHDRMALVTDDVKLLVDFTSDKELLKAQLEALKQRAMSGQLGRSLQYDALLATLTELFNREEERPIVIFQTDGDQLDALGKEPPIFLRPYVPPKKFGLEDLLTAAEKARVTIYSIIPGVPMIGLSGAELLARSRVDWGNRINAQKELFRLKNLAWKEPSPPTDEFLAQSAARWTHLHIGVVQIAKATGGWADYLEKPEQADGLYAHVLNDINQRYVLAYYPKNRARDGKRRKVSYEVRGHPEYIILGRRSYFAPLP